MSGREREISCQWVSDSIESYVDGDVSQHDKAMIERHIRKCSGCRETLLLAEDVREELRALPTLRCPETVAKAVFDRIGARRSKEERFSRALRRFKAWVAGRHAGIPRAAVASAIAILVIGSALLIGRSQRSQDPISAQQVAEAEAALRWTFAYVNEISRRSGFAVRDEVFQAGVVAPVHRAVRAALEAEPRTPNKDGGSI